MTINISGGVNVNCKENGLVIWMTGLSGSGKTTLSESLWYKMTKDSDKCVLLDGDIVRSGLCSDLGFNDEDRKENIRRIFEISNILSNYNVNVITSFISPLRESRIEAKRILGNRLIEVYVNCPIEVCEQRDVKGLYKKARDGIIHNFTGITSLYEVPQNPDIIVDTNLYNIEQCVIKIYDFFLKRANND